VTAAQKFADWKDFSVTGLAGFFKSVIDSGIAAADEIDKTTG
jgi:hypothetical protein